VTHCVAAILVRNEAAPDRYFARALTNCARFCDAIVVLDDNSTDETVALAKAAEKVVAVETVHGVDREGWWRGSRESAARQQLWELACAHAGPEGWVYVADADHELIGLLPDEFRALLAAEGCDSWAFPLFDCWDSDQLMRVDGFWQAWHLPRPWLARALPGSWGERGIHSGHLPQRDWVPGLAPGGCGIRHLGYIQRDHRVAKMQRYLDLGVLT
jgi:glycosyltransferase involved in cell wall biosynthesis